MAAGTLGEYFRKKNSNTEQMSNWKFKNYVTDEGVTMLLYGDIDEWCVSAENVVRELSALEQTGKKIMVRINSCGGSVFEGIAIYNAIKNSKADITIYVDGIAASMASVVALCGKPVYMSQYAQLMMHCVSSTVIGNTKDVERQLEVMKQLENTIVKMYASKTGIAEEKIREMWMDGTDHWMTAQQAKDVGIIDGIYDAENPNGIDATNADAVYKYVTNRFISKQNKREMIDKLKKMPKFANCATDEELMAKITEVMNKASECDELKSKIAELEKTAKEAEIKAILDKAIEEHKVTKPVADNLAKAYANDAEGLTALLSAMQGKKKVEIDETVDSLESKTWDELDKADLLSALKEKNPEAYAKKFAEKFGK